MYIIIDMSFNLPSVNLSSIIVLSGNSVWCSGVTGIHGTLRWSWAERGFCPVNPERQCHNFLFNLPIYRRAGIVNMKTVRLWLFSERSVLWKVRRWLVKTEDKKNCKLTNKPKNFWLASKVAPTRFKQLLAPALMSREKPNSAAMLTILYCISCILYIRYYYYYLNWCVMREARVDSCKMKIREVNKPAPTFKVL